MKKNFLKTIYFDNSQLGKKETIEKIYQNQENINLMEKYETSDEYIKNIPVFKKIGHLDLQEQITYFVGENGSGKSTLLEYIATTFGFNKEGGTKNTNFQTNNIDNLQSNWLSLSWQQGKLLYGYFFRAEGIYNFVNNLQDINVDGKAFLPYGGENLHNFSHGQQFMKVLESQMNNVGFYIFDEIESALSPENQLKAIEIIKYMAKNGSQFIIATHSPIILSIKQNSQILSFDYGYIHEVDYDLVPCVDIYRRVLKK